MMRPRHRKSKVLHVYQIFHSKTSSFQLPPSLLPSAPSSPPLNLTFVEIGSSYILLQWLPPLPVYHNGIIDHYLINLKDGNSSELNITTLTSQPSADIGSLQPQRTYTCSVAAVTVSLGPFSSSISFTTESDGML